MAAASAVLVDSTIADCVASDSCGGGIWVDEANVTLQDGSRIERCTSLRGGGVLAYKGEIALESSSVSECHAPIYGSALHLQHGCKELRHGGFNGIKPLMTELLIIPHLIQL